MTYSPGSPGNSGYQPGSYGAPSPGSYGSPAPAPSYTPPAEPGPSKLPEYLNIAVVLLGIGAYVAAFGPVFTASTNLGPFSVEATSTGGILLTLATVLAALLAAIGLLPKTKGYPTLIALLAVLGLLAVVEQIVNKPQAATIGWALWLVLAFVVLQAAAAVVVLLFDTGVLTPPAPKPPRYEAPYGSYGSYGQQYGGQGGYYGQQQPGQHTPQHAAPPSAQRPNYPPAPQYGGYQQGPSAGAYNTTAPLGGSNEGPPTPPTGFPSFSPPPAVGSGQHQASGAAPTPAPGQGQSSPQTSGPTSGSSPT